MLCFFMNERWIYLWREESLKEKERKARREEKEEEIIVRLWELFVLIFGT